MSFTVGSLFDGSGGFPLAAFMSSGIPKWASEIEPYPIAVTKSRFPHMQHLGSVTDINGAEVEPVDVITFGSPCQDLSVAGKRAGLKHENNGDDETTRSGLFMEAVRIIKQMREATNGVYPRIAVWENVPGAFSSNKGQDFRIVLEELIKICEPKAVMPDVPKKGWPYADSYRGDGWSLAYRVFDAQYWGVPQRRRRIYLVLDLTGGCAREILFERDGLRGYFAEGGTPWKGITPDVERGIRANDNEGANGYSLGCDLYNLALTGDKAVTLNANSCATGTRVGPTICDVVIAVDQGGGKSGANHYDNLSPTLTCTHGGEPAVTYAVATQQGGAEITDNGICPTITAAAGMSGNNQPWCCFRKTGILVVRPAVAYLGSGKEIVGTLMANAGTKLWLGNQEVFSGDYHIIEQKQYYIVRRLTPIECARLQGFADKWAVPDTKTEFTDEDYKFWLNVRNTHAEINGKQVKEYTKQQMLTWYNKLHTDSSEYKLWGNGIAFPCALYVMQGIEDVLNKN